MTDLANITNPADSRIVELGATLKGIVATELDPARAWLDEIFDLFYDEVERHATWPADQDEWTRHDAGSYCAARCRVEKETDIGKSFSRALDAVEAAEKRIDSIWLELQNITPHTAEGRSIRRWARAIVRGDI